MMENTNEMTIIFDSRPVNEALARVAVASFCTQLNPTLEEISDLKNTCWCSPAASSSCQSPAPDR